MMGNPFESLDVILAPANSIRGALFRLRDVIDEIAGHDIAYEYMLRKTSYVRADLIHVTTLPDEHNLLYVTSGGTNSDPVIENAGDMVKPMYIDLNDLTRRPGTKYYKNEFFLKLIRDGCPYVHAFAFSDTQNRGYGVFTIMDSRPREIVEPLAPKLTELGFDIHQAIKRRALYQAYFKLGEKELSTLERVALGRSTDDIAVLDQVSRRTIELRLKSARTKLRARNSTEAVYKAVSYGLINPD